MSSLEPTRAQKRAGQRERAAAVSVAKAKEPLDRNSRLLYQTIRRALWAACRLWFRIDVRNRENIPAQGAFVLAPIHRSNLDFALVSCVTERHMRYMAKNSLWHVAPVFSRFFTALGGFPVDRNKADLDALRIAQSIVDAGEPLVMFPEGARQSGPVIKPCFDGPAYLAGRAGIPIVPLGIGGSERAMPKGAWIIRPRRISLVIGTPIAPPPRTEKGRVPRSAVREVTAQLSEEIQILFDEAQAVAGS